MKNNNFENENKLHQLCNSIFFCLCMLFPTVIEVMTHVSFTENKNRRIRKDTNSQN